MLSPSIVSLSVLLLWAAPGAGIAPYRVADINPLVSPADSSPADFVPFRGIDLFSADDGISGREPWRSDGTAAGTYQLQDLCPGQCSGPFQAMAETDGGLFFVAADHGGSGTALWVTDGTPHGTFRLAGGLDFRDSWWAWVPQRHLFFFSADDGVHGYEVWRTNGTAAGTYQVKDIRPGPESSVPRGLTPFAGKLYFRADDGVQGPALWASDGTPQGTRLIKDTWPGSASHTGPFGLCSIGSRLLFFAPSPSHGTELWRSDGTSQGTVLAAELVPGSGSPFIDDALVLGKRLLFVAEVGHSGQELWVTDGTKAGTRALTHFAYPNVFDSLVTGESLFLQSTLLGGKLVFGAFSASGKTVDLWLTDGTPAGTRRFVEDIVYPYYATAGGKLFLTKSDAAHGMELWVSNGTTAGTHLVSDLCPGTCSAYPFGQTALGGWLLFGATTDGGSTYQIWRTDGTAQGTVQLTDLQGPNNLQEFGQGILPGAVLFAAQDPQHGRELWRTNGTLQGTFLLRDINTADQRAGSFPGEFQTLGDQALFFATDGQQGGLWKSDGTAAGTTLVDTTLPPFNLNGVEATSQLFLTTSDGFGTSLWRTDGTAAGTRRLTSPGVRPVESVCAVGSAVFFTAFDDEPYSPHLWTSDGTAQGTVAVSGLAPHEMAAFAGRLFFIAGVEGINGLWTSDGTPQGTVMVKEIGPGSSAVPALPTVHAGRLWFFADDGVHGNALWVSDRTAAGTFATQAAATVLGSSFVATNMVSANGRLFFGGANSTETGLWVSDGTAAGTQRLGPVALASSLLPALKPEVFQGALFFFTGDGELWSSDGTLAGTHEVGVVPGGQSLRALGDRLYFTSLQNQLWASDGTAAGTQPVMTAAGSLVRAGQRIFFQGYDPTAGNELWAIGPP